MVAAVSAIVGDRVAGGLVVTPPGVAVAPEPIQTLVGSHPIPDESSLQAGAAMLEFAAKTTGQDLVLFCLSGGASAIMEATKPGISLDDVQVTTDSLLRSGADIRTLNAVRVRLSRVKGGGLARAFRAQVVVLVLSDVIGNDLSVVGSGPFLAPKDSRPHAHAVAFGFEDRLPPAVLAALTEPAADFTPLVPHVVVGSAALLWPLASAAAVKRGLEPFGYADPLKGEARTMASKIMRLARANASAGERFLHGLRRRADRHRARRRQRWPGARDGYPSRRQPNRRTRNGLSGRRY